TASRRPPDRAGEVGDDGLLVAEVVRRPPAVRARARREQRAREQVVDRHVRQPRDAVGELGRDVAPAAEHLADAVRLEPERVRERLPAADAVAEEPERGPHVPLLLRGEPHGVTGGKETSMPYFSIACTTQARLWSRTFASTSLH